MDCLYKTTTKYTFEEYKRYAWILFVRDKKRIVMHTLLFAFFIFESIYLKEIFPLLLMLVYLIVLVLVYNRKLKKTFYSNKEFQNADVDFEFYDTYFIQIGSYGSTKLEYNKLYKIIETKTNFYLMVAKNQGYMLVKDNFPDGLAEFLRNIKL